MKSLDGDVDETTEQVGAAKVNELVEVNRINNHVLVGVVNAESVEEITHKVEA